MTIFAASLSTKSQSPIISQLTRAAYDELDADGSANRTLPSHFGSVRSSQVLGASASSTSSVLYKITIVKASEGALKPSGSLNVSSISSRTADSYFSKRSG